MPTHVYSLTTWRLRWAGLGLLACAALSGCSQPTQPQGEADATTRAAQLQMQARQAFAECQDQALTLDRSARQQQSVAQYALAANQMLGCVNQASSDVSQSSLMRLHALAIVDYLKAGEVQQAQQHLVAFTQSYPDQDLYFNDAYSFVDTMSLLLQASSVQPSLSNARKETLRELQRRDYWLQH